MIFKKVMSQCVSMDYCKGWNDAVDEIEKSKNHAKWLKVKEEGHSYYVCSNCDSDCSQVDGENWKSQYCPFCGAKMDM